MTEFVCPLCQRRHTPRREDVVRVWHAPCSRTTTVDIAVQMSPVGHRVYEIYCGNFDCPSRAELVLWPVRDADLVDGEVWLCEQCQPAVVDVETDVV